MFFFLNKYSCCRERRNVLPRAIESKIGHRPFAHLCRQLARPFQRPRRGLAVPWAVFSGFAAVCLPSTKYVTSDRAHHRTGQLSKNNFHWFAPSEHFYAGLIYRIWMICIRLRSSDLQGVVMLSCACTGLYISTLYSDLIRFACAICTRFHVPGTW